MKVNSRSRSKGKEQEQEQERREERRGGRREEKSCVSYEFETHSYEGGGEGGGREGRGGGRTLLGGYVLAHHTCRHTMSFMIVKCT